MHTVKERLIITVASIGLAAGIVGYASAQDNPTGDANRPANERIEKGNKAETPQHKMNATTGQTEEQRNGGAGEAPRKAQNATGAGASQTGQTQQQPEGASRTGQNVDQEKRRGDMDNARTGRDEQPKGDVDTRTGQGERDQRDGASAQSDRDQNGAHDHVNVRVSGNLHISEEKATHISQTLRNQGHRETVNVNVRVGAPLPESVRPMPLPPEVVEVAPEYRGYDYVVDNDQIIFVQPTTHVVVGMIDTGEATAQMDTEQPIARARPCPVD